MIVRRTDEETALDIVLICQPALQILLCLRALHLPLDERQQGIGANRRLARLCSLHLDEDEIVAIREYHVGQALAQLAVDQFLRGGLKDGVTGDVLQQAQVHQLCWSEASTHSARGVPSRSNIEPVLVECLLHLALWNTRDKGGLARSKLKLPHPHETHPFCRDEYMRGNARSKS